MSVSAFHVRDLTVYLQGQAQLRKVLRNVEIDVKRGRTFALLGESGSGKTCLVHSVLGTHPGKPGVVRGSASVLGREIFSGLDQQIELTESPTVQIRKDLAGWRRAMEAVWEERLGNSVTLVPQDATTSLSPFHTIGQMLQMALHRGNPLMDRASLRENALQWLERVEMYDVEKVFSCYIHELSGGMAQRVAIAVALAPDPELLIADEPTTGLDATLRISILALLHDMVVGKNVTLLLVTHDNEAARMLASDVAVLYEGMVVETGPVELVLNADVSPKHPYVQFLLESERKLLAGESPRWAPKVPAPSQGCPFVTYCDRRVEVCEQHTPALDAVGHSHRIACHRSEG